MHKPVGLIPAKDAMIVWKKRRCYQAEFALKVYYRDVGEENAYDSWPFSSGCAIVGWPKWTEQAMMRECFRILLSQGVSNKQKIKEALFEFGKIQELLQMRVIYWELYYQDQMPFEGLEKSLYAWDFCSGR